jgi:hypothetical protein
MARRPLGPSCAAMSRPRALRPQHGGAWCYASRIGGDSDCAFSPIRRRASARRYARRHMLAVICITFSRLGLCRSTCSGTATMARRAPVHTKSRCCHTRVPGRQVPPGGCRTAAAAHPHGRGGHPGQRVVRATHGTRLCAQGTRPIRSCCRRGIRRPEMFLQWRLERLTGGAGRPLYGAGQGDEKCTQTTIGPTGNACGMLYSHACGKVVFLVATDNLSEPLSPGGRV